VEPVAEYGTLASTIRHLPREEAKGETGFSKKDNGSVKLLETIGGVALYTALFPARSEILGYQSRCGSKYVKPANPSQCVDVLVNPFSNPASKTRFLRAV